MNRLTFVLVGLLALTTGVISWFLSATSCRLSYASFQSLRRDEDILNDVSLFIRDECFRLQTNAQMFRLLVR